MAFIILKSEVMSSKLVLATHSALIIINYLLMSLAAV